MVIIGPSNELLRHRQETMFIHHQETYHKISNIRRTKSQNFTVSRFGLQLSLRNIFKPSVKCRMKM